MKVGGASLVLLTALAACAPRPPPAPPRRTSLGLDISTITLPNGLRVVVVKDPTATDIQVTARYQVGAVEDGAHPGMAHLVEHLMFQQILDGQPIFALLEDVATHFNATTTFDATNYVARAPRSALGTLLAIEVARLELRCSTITDVAFVNERDVVTNELAQRDLSTDAFGALHRVLYPEGHPYRRGVGGTRASVGAIDREDTCAFMDARYAPNNAAVVISGKLSEADVQTALAALGKQIAKREGSKPARVGRPKAQQSNIEMPVSLDDDVLVLAWPLPLDPALQVKVRAIAAALPRLIDAEIKGAVIGLELGDTGAPMIGVAIVAGENETLTQAAAGAWRGIESLPDVFLAKVSRLADVAFDRLQEAGVYALYASLEDGSDRDIKLATHVLAGRDPRTAITDELQQLRGLSRFDGMEIASQYLSARRPTSIVLRASVSKKSGKRTTLSAPIHDMGQRRTARDPALARRPLELAPAADSGAKTRVLPNGLRIVLLPFATVPTFDARLIFGSGTGDEPSGRRGVALLAAHTLTWDLHFAEDLIAFARAGGMRSADVSTDRTSFSVQGLDMNLDVVLAGLRRWVRDGTYDDTAQAFMTAIQRATKRFDDQGVVTDAWRAALFGEHHPYVRAGLGRHASTQLSLGDAAHFRSSFYTPDNATLVIAGRFDPALADRWIDFLFADWHGRAATRATVPITPIPASIARVDDTAMLQVRVALPAGTTSRAQELVAAEMLAGVVRDVRYRLGASYTMDAQLAETRIASFYVLDGWIDANRSTAAVQLVRDRIELLRRDPALAAEAFVVARARVVTQLRSQVGNASSLAARVEEDVASARAPMSHLDTARAVQALTIDEMRPTLASLDLAAATILINGPAAEVKSAFGVLGRNPVYLASPPPATETASPGTVVSSVAGAEQHVLLSDLAPALTVQPPQGRTLLLYPSVGLLSLKGDDVGGVANASLTGPSLGAGAGYRVVWWSAIGGYAEVGRYTGSYQIGMVEQAVSVVPVHLTALWHVDTQPLWTAGLIGINFDRIAETGGDARWRSGTFYGLMGGYDFLRPGAHRVGLAARWQRSFGDDGFSIYSIGFYYRQ